MYLDKPMNGHNLMQAIARVNRVFKDKPGGLVVDYLGIADALKHALHTYTASGGKGGAAPPPPTDKVPEMPAEDWRNTGLNLLMLLAQAYYRLLKAAICCDLDPETSYRLEFADGSNPPVVLSGRVLAESGVDVPLFVLPLPAGFR